MSMAGLKCCLADCPFLTFSSRRINPAESRFAVGRFRYFYCLVEMCAHVILPYSFNDVAYTIQNGGCQSFCLQRSGDVLLLMPVLCYEQYQYQQQDPFYIKKNFVFWISS